MRQRLTVRAANFVFPALPNARDPPSFCCTSGLVSLQLYGNPLEYLPELSPATNLRSLSLANVRIMADASYSRCAVRAAVTVGGTQRGPCACSWLGHGPWSKRGAAVAGSAAGSRCVCWVADARRALSALRCVRTQSLRV